MSWQLVQLAQVPAMPWRNGGGMTRELVGWPQSADFSWRISVAEVASSGPFSRFEGVQRWLAILRGAGVRLAVNAALIELTPESEPLVFDGSDAVECQLLDGPVQDLNLMLRGPAQRTATAQMTRLGGSSQVAVKAATTAALYAVDAAATVWVDGAELVVPSACLAWRTFQQAAEVRIAAHDAVWMMF